MQVKCRYTLILSLVEQVLTYSNNFIMLRNHYTLLSSIYQLCIKPDHLLLNFCVF